MSNKKSMGTIMVLIAALLWSSNAPFVRWISLDAFSVAGFRSLIAGLVLLPFFRPKKMKFNRYFFGFLICFLALTFGIIVALKTTSSAIAVGMQYSSCLWLFLLAKPKKKDFSIFRIWPMLLILVGVAFSMLSSAEGVSWLGNIIAITTSFSFAGLTYFAKKLDTDNPIGLASISNLILGVIAMIIARPSLSSINAIDLTEWLVLLYLGAFQIGLSYSLYYSGLKHVSATTASVLCPLEMILGPVWTAIFLNELPDLLGLVGFIVVIIGVLGEAIISSRFALKNKETQSDVKWEEPISETINSGGKCL